MRLLQTWKMLSAIGFRSTAKALLQQLQHWIWCMLWEFYADGIKQWSYTRTRTITSHRRGKATTIQGYRYFCRHGGTIESLGVKYSEKEPWYENYVYTNMRTLPRIFLTTDRKSGSRHVPRFLETNGFSPEQNHEKTFSMCDTTSHKPQPSYTLRNEMLETGTGIPSERIQNPLPERLGPQIIRKPSMQALLHVKWNWLGRFRTVETGLHSALIHYNGENIKL